MAPPTPHPTARPPKAAKEADAAGVQTVGIVLAGGRSQRFGSPKAAALFRGRPLLHHATDLLRTALDDVRVVGGAPEAPPAGVRWHPDGEPGAGPLAALETALRLAAGDGAEGVLLLGVDMPLVPPALLQDLLADGGSGIVVPESTGRIGIEPLCARYPLSLLDDLVAARGAGARSLRDLISRVGAGRISLDRVRRHGDPDLIFLNVNTPADLARAEAEGGG
jgi:molybdopterin-guanine dinucleotide biosynthesis protein A